MFNRREGGLRADQELKALVKNPLVRYDRLVGNDGYLVSHDEADYHKLSATQAENFETTFKDSSINVLNSLDTSRREKIKENRDR